MTLNQRLMEVKENNEQQLPLLPPTIRTAQKTQLQRTISQTFQTTAHLANLLPTGTVLAFQLLSPVFSNQGRCDQAGRLMTCMLVLLCGLSCFISSFTDSFRDKDGNIHYVFATPKGLWVIDGSVEVSPGVGVKFKLKLIDLVHAFLSVLVFVVIVLLDQNVVGCFCSSPSLESQEILTALPVGIGVTCSMLFAAFPTTRHGIGFPLSAVNSVKYV